MPDIVVIFFVLGIMAGLAKSDLKVPQAAYDTLSILLMLTLGLKGGMALHGNFHASLLPELVAILIMGFIIPLVLYPLLAGWVKLSSANSASLAAHYGSVSAGTFAVALGFAETLKLPIAPETTLYLVLLELPAIIVGISLYRKLTGSAESNLCIIQEAVTSKSVILLIGGVVIGALYGHEGAASITPLFLGGFKALLALFLLEMGLSAAKYLYPLPWQHWRLALFALLAPCTLALVGAALSVFLQLPIGSALILTTLMASASYIAAPAAIRAAIPQADVGLAIFASFGITFPFNTLIGIPLYYQLLTAIGG